MTNLDSVLKSRDITLLTKVHIVKAMVFPASRAPGFLPQGVPEGPKLTASAPKAGAGCLQRVIADPLSCQSG